MISRSRLIGLLNIFIFLAFLSAGCATTQPSAPPQPVEAPTPVGDQGTKIPIRDLRPNPFQPRQEWTDAELEILAESLKIHGLLEPILVRPAGGQYEIVAGERRYQAAAAMLRDLGLTRIRLMTNNPEKVAALRAEGIELVDHMTLHGTVNPHNERYLQAKRKRAGHL